MMEFDELPPFDEEDTSRQEVTLARQERIAAARRAATSYTAKIEEAQVKLLHLLSLLRGTN